MHVMKLKVAFVAAAIGFASGAQANFANTAASGGSDFLFGFLSGTSSYVKDLGINFDSFNPNAVQSFALESFSFTPSQISGGNFQVIAGNVTTGVPDLYTTVTGNPTPATLGITSYLQISDAPAGYDGAVTPGFNGPEGVPVTSNDPGQITHISKILGFRWGNNTTFSTGLGGGNVAQLYLLDSDPNTGDVVTSVLGSFNIQASPAGGNAFSLVYAPIPEPSTYAMLAAGLVGVGAIARRKSRG